MMNDTAYQRSYADDTDLLGRVFALLDLSFPGLSSHARGLERFGLHWDQVSTPFVLSHDDRVLTHVGVLEMPMIVDGREVLVGGIHAACTHPNHRRRGYFRSVIEAALAWCDTRYATQMLIAGEPEIYEPFGFRVVQECRFVSLEHRTPKTPTTRKLRQLDLDKPDDLSLLHRLLDERSPVSRRLGVVRERDVFLFCQATRPMWYAEDLDAILCVQADESTLRVHDIVATRVPSLWQLIDCMASSFQRVEVYFVPDQLDAHLTPEPHVVDGDSLLMARGERSGLHGELMLPRTARL